MRNVARRGLAVGFFDGVHLGHRAILESASAALTFANHPLSLLAPEKAPRLIMSAADRVAAIRACGVGDVVVLDFTRELSEMPAEDFAERHLKRAARDGAVYCGDNWRFGRGGRGDADMLRRMGFAVEVVPYATYGGERISSTRIRAALESGKVRDANAMLGREWFLRGKVVRGKGLGSQIGYPTVNVIPEDLRLDLQRGVYEVVAFGARALANYGVAPTCGESAWRAPVLELHFTDQAPKCAEGDAVSVSFRRFMRPEMKFDSVDELKSQIARDVCVLTGVMI
jgi:riboflavin kinase/FMN adenylyltransferase